MNTSRTLDNFPTHWEENKTIIIPKKHLKKWLRALRSGDYEQGIGALHRFGNYFCCLGVLQHCLTGDVERTPEGSSLGLPTIGWLKEFGILFRRGLDPLASSLGCAAPELRPSLSAINMNDGAGCRQFSFEEIADHIEACAQPY